MVALPEAGADQIPSQLQLLESIDIATIRSCTLNDLECILLLIDRLMRGTAGGTFLLDLVTDELNRRGDELLEGGMVHVPCNDWTNEELRKFVLSLRAIFGAKIDLPANVHRLLFKCFDVAVGVMSARL